jgi:hypothetical protein
LSCDFPLIAALSSCKGCPPGKYGSPPDCFSCGIDEECPGLLSYPIRNKSAISFQGIPYRRDATVGDLSIQLPVLVAVGCGCLSVFVYLVPLLSRYTSLFYIRGLGSGISYIYRKIDIFAFRHNVAVGAPLLKKPSRLGGMLTVLGIIAYLTLSSILVLRRNSDNILWQDSLSIYDASTIEASAALPWRGKFELHVAMVGETPHCNEPLFWSSFGLLSGSWAQLSRGPTEA